ncbi:hypothetical protein Tco_0178106 [Tanacetum coccineum]
MSKRYGYIFKHLKQSFMPRKDFTKMAGVVKSTMQKIVPSMVDKRVNKIEKTLVSLYVAEAASSFVHDLQYQLYLKMKDDEQVRNADLSIWWSLKIKFEKTAPPISPCRIAIVRTRDHKDHHDDDARPEGDNSAKRQTTFDHRAYSLGESSFEQAMNESNPSGSREIDEAQLQEAVNDMLRVRTIKEDLSLQIPKKPALVYQSCERDPKAPPMILLNQDLFYLKHGNSGSKKYVLSLHKQEKKRDNPDEVYSESKIVEVVRTLYELVGLIYENNKKEKRVVIVKEIPNFCDATLIRVLRSVENMNKDVKNGYANPKLSDNDAEYLRFYEEYIKDWLRHQDRMRCWEMYVNVRPLGSRRDRPE